MRDVLLVLKANAVPISKAQSIICNIFVSTPVFPDFLIKYHASICPNKEKIFPNNKKSGNFCRFSGK